LNVEDKAGNLNDRQLLSLQHTIEEQPFSSSILALRTEDVPEKSRSVSNWEDNTMLIIFQGDDLCQGVQREFQYLV